jgi:CheY-like chemotaxis protein
MKRIGSETEPVVGARERLERSLQLTMRLVDDLLDISRIAEDKLQLRVERISLAAAVEMAVQNTRSQASESGQHELRVALPAEPLWLDADPVRLAQVIGNLLSNAARFTPAGGQIELMAERDAARQTIEITVRDSGVGIAPDEIDQIFGMFRQGSPSSGRMSGGLGVGLALAKQLVELHGGAIEARSAGVGKGSEFIVRLPAAGPPAAEPAVPKKRRAAAPPRRILLVDDNRDHAESMRLLFERLGHTVRVVYDGSSAVAAALEFAPDVALVDIGLPDLDGYEVARRLQREPQLRQLKLIAQTGWGRDEDRLRSAEAGFAHHLVKPVEIDKLEDLLAPPDAAR